MTTVLGDIWERIEAALTAIASNPDVEIEPAGDPDVFPALSGYDGGSIVIEREAMLTRRQLSFTVEGYVQRGDGKAGTADRADLHAQAVAAIMADDTFGGTVELVEDADLRMFTASLASKRRLAFSQDFTIQYVTSRTNPALPA